jgi:DHA2 family multidrug resistance protein
VRNIGSSIGISIVTVQLAHNLAVNRTELVSGLTASNQNLDAVAHIGSDQLMLSMLDNEVTKQSLMIGYIDDFKLMMLITLAVIPLVFFLRKPARPAGPMAQAAAAVAD